MPSNSIEYFYQKNNVNPNFIFGYFDFASSGYSGNNELTGLQEYNFSKLQIFDQNGDAWKYSGYLNLDSNTYLKYDGLSVSPYAIALSFSRESEKDCVLVSTFGEGNGLYSGFNVGINPYGFPYIEYVDNVYGKVCMLNENVRFYKTGLLFLEIDDNSCSIGSFTDIKNFSIEKCKFSQNGYIKSNDLYFGGNPELNLNFSGKFFELIIQSKSFLSYDPNMVLSGFLFDIEKIKTTGFISGQTGVLYGDIISVSGCEFFIADTRTDSISVDVYTGIVEYFSSEQEFRDFNDDLFYNFSTSYLTGVINSGLEQSLPSISFSCFPETNYNQLYQYDSGYVLTYSIINSFAIPKFEEFFIRYSTGIAYNFFNTGDSVFNIIIFDEKNKNNILNFNQSSQNFINIENQNIFGFYDSDLLTGNFDLFYNGQMQRRSTDYSQVLISGLINYVPTFDFFKSGLKLFNNNIYNINFNNIVGTEGFGAEYYTLNQAYNAGSTVGSINFNNSLIFFNGQLLTSGIDYINNTILFNIDGNVNTLTKIPLNGILYKNVIFTGNSSIGGILGNTLNIKTNKYLKDSSMVWLNGLRMKLNEDYVEIDDSIFSNQFIETNGYLIYNNIL